MSVMGIGLFVYDARWSRPPSPAILTLHLPSTYRLPEGYVPVTALVLSYFTCRRRQHQTETYLAYQWPAVVRNER